MFSLKIYSGPKATVPALPCWPAVQAHCQKYFCILLRAGCTPAPLSLSSASPALGRPTWGHLWDLPLCRRTPDGETDGLPVSFLSVAVLGLTDVLPGFVWIACFKNSSYPPTVQIIIFQVASNRDYFSFCLL